MKEALVIKFLNGTCSDAERKLVMDWLSEDQSQDEFDEILNRHWRKEKSETDLVTQERILKNIHNRISAKSAHVRPIPLFSSLRVAASVILIAFASYILIQTYFTQMTPEEVEEVFSQVLVERATGIGEKMTLKMADGSIITLNSDSKIAFASDFGRSHRQVFLIGEAFFEVQGDPSLPFEVRTDQFLTTALGTEFNVFARDSEVRVSLTSGSVKVEDTDQALVLRPGEQASTENASGFTSLTVGSFDIQAVTGWKEGKLVYKQPTALHVILGDLERWYGVEMTIEKRVDISKRVSGTFSNGNLNDILNGLGFSMGFRYDIKEKKVEIKI